MTSAVFDGEVTTFTGTLSSAPTTTFTIELFVNSVCNPSGYGEGERFFASLTVATDDAGNAAFTLAVPVAVDVGSFLSATATDPGGNTSEFAACVAVEGPGAPGTVASLPSAITVGAAFVARVGFQTRAGRLVDRPAQPLAESVSETPAAGALSGLDFAAIEDHRPDAHSAAFRVDALFSQTLEADVDRVLMTAY